MTTAEPSPKPSYEQLEARLAQADAIVETLRLHEVDAIIGKDSVDFVRLREVEEAKQTAFQRLELLSQITSELLTSENPQGIVDSLCRKIMQHLGCDVFFNYLVDGGQQRLTLNAWAGVSPETALQIQRLDFGDAVCGSVARDRRRIVVENIQATPDPRADLVRSFGVQAFACHPLLNQGRTIGTLSFGSRAKAAFNEDELALMQAVTDQVAIAMQRVQLMESLEQRVAERTAVAEYRANQLRALALELTQAEQRERRRLAQVLHDHLQQLLVAAKIQLGIVSRKVQSDALAQPLRRINELLEQSIAESRSLAVELSPPILYDRGLVDALGWLARQFLERHQLPVGLELDTEAEPRDVGIRVFLFQVVRELLLNVVKHAHARLAHIQSTRPGEDCVRIVVSDTGSGFDPVQLNRGGTAGGFGLFSIRERLELIGGRLEVDSAPGRGTRMIVEAPLGQAISPARLARKAVATASTAALATCTAAVEPSLPGKTKIRVLVADDHRVVREGLITVLQEHPGIEVIGEAADGQQALDLALRMKPDVVLMDIAMPVMDGIEATRHITEALPGTRVIGLSMHEQADMATAMRNAGARAYLSKDTASDILIDTILHCEMAGVPAS
jgi:signal transduction histidine kinase/ActR/RegA family two-component response regulator